MTRTARLKVVLALNLVLVAGLVGVGLSAGSLGVLDFYLRSGPAR